MSKHTQKVTRVVTRTLTAAALAAAPLTIANACSNDREPAVVNVEETGRLQLNLTGVSNTNLVYRLRNGVFTISGRSTGFSAEVNTETEPDRTSLLVELAPDTYEVLLQPGFFLELLPDGVPLTARRNDARSTPVKPAPRAALALDGGAPIPGEPMLPGEPPSPPVPPTNAVDATLISSNPGIVTISPSVVSPLNFVFRVGDGTVETGTGVLDLGIEIIDNGRVCSPDDFEPNDIDATAITPGVQISATLCEFDIDNYIFPSPVAEGEAFSVLVGFQTAFGDIDAVLIDAESGLAVAFGFGVADNEILNATSDGGSYILQASLFFDPDGGGNSYTVDIGEFTNTATNSCCEESGFPGCNDDAVLSCVCALDSFCCQVAFDAICVSEALTSCGATCSNEGAESDCCTASAAPGCTDQAVHDCVCATDLGCCTSGFDQVCVAQAIAECGAACSLPPPQSDCCSASAVPGCTVPEVQECVCGIDPFCCAGSFDENCVGLAQGACGATCQF